MINDKIEQLQQYTVIRVSKSGLLSLSKYHLITDLTTRIATK